MGFSQKAGMPAMTEARIKGACAGVEEAMTTASGPEPSTASMCPAFPPTSFATSSARCASASPTSISSTLGSRASTPAWRAPIRPAPSSPTFILLLDAEQGAELFLPYFEIAGRVLFGDEREAGIDPGIDRLAARGPCGLLDADLPHRVGVLRHGGVHVAADDRLGGLDRPVYTDQDRIAPVSLQRLYGAEGHLVVSREDGIQIGVGLQEVLHGAHRLEPVEVCGDLANYLDVRVFYGLPHSGLPLVAGDRAGDARYEA